MAQAKPVPGFENVWVGELSFLYDAPLKSYLLMFKDFTSKMFVLYWSSTPYGPFVGPLTFSPCGSTSSQPSWMESGWGPCYGGYMLPDSFGADGHHLYFTISVWDPYTTVLMTMTLTTPSTNGSTSQPTSTSSDSISATATTSGGQDYGATLVLPLSIAALGCVIAVIAARKYAKRKPIGVVRVA
jgi:hypothetical protein